MIYGQQRDQYRRVFVDAWRKHGQGAPLEPLERTIVDVVAAHPEYHALLAEPDVLERDFEAADGDANPFLHMGLHITIIEQVTGDRPAGIRALYAGLRGRFDDAHALEHAMMGCLAQSLQDAGMRGGAPDEAAYLACIRRLQAPML